MAMFDALRQKFKESLKQESHQHEEACQVGHRHRLRHKVQEHIPMMAQAPRQRKG